MSKGGKRPGAGRPKGEATVRMSIPESLVPYIKEAILNGQDAKEIEERLDADSKLWGSKEGEEAKRFYKAWSSPRKKAQELAAVIQRMQWKRHEQFNLHHPESFEAKERRLIQEESDLMFLKEFVAKEVQVKCKQLKQEQAAWYRTVVSPKNLEIKALKEKIEQLERKAFNDTQYKKDPIPENVWRYLAQLAHPDKNNGSETATKAMEYLNKLRSS